jgi:hypothetical protein
LIEKNLHTRNSKNGRFGFWQSVDYAYNIRGWLKSINDATLTKEKSDLFGMELLYNEGLAALSGTKQYNGNISGMKWKTKSGTQRNYGFQYDAINRLGKAKYGEGKAYNVHTNRYTVAGKNWGNIKYDKNGNIINLWRKGMNRARGSYTYGDIDKLSYAYSGNKLTAVNDAIADIGKHDFRDGRSRGHNEYSYDANGNMIRDANKGIVSIKYNYLNFCPENTKPHDTIVRQAYSLHRHID